MSDPSSSAPQLPTLTGDRSSWRGASLLSVKQITRDGLELLFHTTQQMRNAVKSKRRPTTISNAGGACTAAAAGVAAINLIATVFYEASTRTSCSFQAAISRLGGNYIHVDGKGNTSANMKGETLADTIRCLACYVDAIVLRHPITGSVGNVIAKRPGVPIINAGDGTGEHPTQALLDVFTIYDKLSLAGSSGTDDGDDIASNNNNKKQKTTHNDNDTNKPFVIVMLGDLKHGRTVHSLVKLLASDACRGPIWQTQIIIRYCSPAGLEMPTSIQDEVKEKNAADEGNNSNNTIQQETYTDLAEACQNANVLYVTRIQRERFVSDQEYERVKGTYVVDEALLKKDGVPDDMIILHPLPRVDEIHTNVDTDPRAVYFEQMANGKYLRMALLALILDNAE